MFRRPSSFSSSSSSWSDDDDDDVRENLVEQEEVVDDSEMRMNREEEFVYSTPPRQRIVPVEDPDAAWEILSCDQEFRDVPVKKLPYVKQSEEERYLRIACISDTHGRHGRLVIPSCDVLIHAGDLTMTGELGSYRNIVQFFQTISAKVIYIAGNHDLTLQPDHYDVIWSRFHSNKIDASQARSIVENTENKYLQDSSCVVEDVCFYGSPWQPEFCGWAFNMDRTKLREKVWSQIPSTTDVLITHGPPLGRGDLLWNNENRVGCVDLLREVQNRILPRLHVFGHIHEGHGLSFDGTTVYVNASSVTCTNYQVRNPVIVIDLPLHDITLPAQCVHPPPCTKTHNELLHWLLQPQQQQKYKDLIPHFQQQTQDPICGQDLVGESAKSFSILCEKLGLHRGIKSTHLKIRETLHDLIMHLTAEAYGNTW
jgi:Icc-related predicted phosphoesterase